MTRPATLLPIDGVRQSYAWGSPSAIPGVLGRQPDGHPFAEWWLGAHPSAPSTIEGSALDRRIADDPVGELGQACAARFEGRLPFLLKLLAADAPLSIQAHPDRAAAEAGYAREDAAGIALDAAHRVYRDRNHKPELICALTTFDALCGFRPVALTAEIFETINAPTLIGVAARLRAEPAPGAIRTVMSMLLRGEASMRQRAVDQVVAACERHLDREGRFSRTARLAVDLAALHPGDPGVVVAMMLNQVRLQPGEALALGAGNLHAYLSGLGVELMANSDNVLRGGLTTKHVDVDELLRVLDPSELADPVRHPTLLHDGAGGDTMTWRTPWPDFALTRHRVAGRRTIAIDGPAIAIVTEGRAMVAARPARSGDAWWVEASGSGTVELDGTATVFVAGVGV